jgi:hypothetical protein
VLFNCFVVLGSCEARRHEVSDRDEPILSAVAMPDRICMHPALCKLWDDAALGYTKLTERPVFQPIQDEVTYPASAVSDRRIVRPEWWSEAWSKLDGRIVQGVPGCTQPVSSSQFMECSCQTLGTNACPVGLVDRHAQRTLEVWRQTVECTGVGQFRGPSINRPRLCSNLFEMSHS